MQNQDNQDNYEEFRDVMHVQRRQWRVKFDAPHVYMVNLSYEDKMNIIAAEFEKRI